MAPLFHYLTDRDPKDIFNQNKKPRDDDEVLTRTI